MISGTKFSMNRKNHCCENPELEDDSCGESGSNPVSTLLIIGGGSAAFAAATRAVELGAERVTIVNDGLPIGGTCVNVGCVPSKTLIRAAESVHRSRSIPFCGIKGSAGVVDFKALMRQKQELVEELRQAKYLDVVKDLPQVRLVEGRARFTGPRAVEVNGESITAERVLIATGTRPFVPDVPGLKESGFLTSETAFELKALPESLIVLGGRYIALECAQMFARLGTKVTILQRSDRILPDEQSDLTDALAGYLRDEGIEVVTGVSIETVECDGGEVVLTARQRTGAFGTFRAHRLLAATGREPNTDGLGLERAGVALTASGAIRVDDALQTTAPGVYAAGDVIAGEQYVYVAAYEGALAAANAFAGEAKPRDYSALAWVIFTDPQVAGVGLDEAQARAAGYDAEAATLPLSHVPRCLAARDTRGFIKLIRDRSTDLLLGARILAPEGGELLMEVAVAMKYRIPVSELKAMFHPYLTLGEGIKLAAIAFGKDVNRLSCCAV
jgi:mercuric reductase